MWEEWKSTYGEWPIPRADWTERETGCRCSEVHGFCRLHCSLQPRSGDASSGLSLLRVVIKSTMTADVVSVRQTLESLGTGPTDEVVKVLVKRHKRHASLEFHIGVRE